MKITGPSDNFEAVLEDWVGARALVDRYDASLRRLLLLLSKPGASEFLYFVAAGCVFMSGPFSWADANISIRCNGDQDEETDCERVAKYSVVDSRSSFELQCGSVFLVCGTASELREELKNFSRFGKCGDNL